MRPTYTTEQTALLVEAREILVTLLSALAHFSERSANVVKKIDRDLSQVSREGE